MDGSTLPYRDPRVDEIIEDPAGYFAAASDRAYKQARQVIEADLHRLHRNGYRPAEDTKNDADRDARDADDAE
ncbi:MAG: hypothetical protein GEV09_04280 [Pseudonocardiaceae bacterium]|nr:hypothetical protein [Pseudonocardiaceae bacterium]